MYDARQKIADAAGRVDDGAILPMALSYNARFDDPNLPGTLHTTVTLRAVSCGVELLALLVEAELPA